MDTFNLVFRFPRNKWNSEINIIIDGVQLKFNNQGKYMEYSCSAECGNHKVVIEKKSVLARSHWWMYILSNYISILFDGSSLITYSDIKNSIIISELHLNIGITSDERINVEYDAIGFDKPKSCFNVASIQNQSPIEIEKNLNAADSNIRKRLEYTIIYPLILVILILTVFFIFVIFNGVIRKSYFLSLLLAVIVGLLFSFFIKQIVTIEKTWNDMLCVEVKKNQSG